MERSTLVVRKSIWTVAAAVVWLSGCHHIGTPAPPPGLSVGTEESAGKLKPKQAAEVQIALAHSLEMHGQSEQALALYEEAVQKDPNRADAWLRLAVLHDQAGKFAESATLYQKALKAQPGSAEIFCDMGYSLYLQHRWSEAEMNLRQALALQANYARAHNNLGLVLARSGKENEALGEFYQAGCGDAEAHVNLAFALTLEQHWPQARQQYQEALKTDPASLPAKRGLQELEQFLARTGSHAAVPSAQASNYAINQVSWTPASGATHPGSSDTFAAPAEINLAAEMGSSFATFQQP